MVLENRNDFVIKHYWGRRTVFTEFAGLCVIGFGIYFSNIEFIQTVIVHKPKDCVNFNPFSFFDMVV